MCNHPNREAAMVRIQGTPVPGVTTKVGSCDPCLHPLVQALNDGGQYTFASCCGHGHRPGWIALTDDRWLVVATEEQRHTIDAAFPVDINGRVWDQTEDGLAERVRALHFPAYGSSADEVWRNNARCDHDDMYWPCPTVTLLADQPDTSTALHDACDHENHYCEVGHNQPDTTASEEDQR